MVRMLIAAVVVASLPVAGWVDATAPREFNFSVFYTVCVAVAAWRLGRTSGAAIGVLAMVTWSATDYFAFTDTPGTQRTLLDYLDWSTANAPAVVWNGVTRLGIFVAFAYLIDRVRRDQVELRSLLRHRDEFLSLMSHELRAPVAAIEIVATGLTQAPDLGAQARTAMGMLLRQARSLATVAEGILSVGRLESGANDLNLEVLDIRDVVGTLDLDARVRVTLPDTPLLVRADGEALGRALGNVVSNALKFSPATLPVEVVVERRGNLAAVRVTDRGIGLTPAEAPRLFRKYGRVKNESTARIEGVGLGLYLTALILRAHDGAVAASSPGRDRGSTFTLTLPHV